MKDNNFKFEEQIKELEQIVESLDEGLLPLDELLEQYKEGILIAKSCREFLDSAQQIIAEIDKDTRILPDDNDTDGDSTGDNNTDDNNLSLEDSDEINSDVNQRWDDISED